MKGLLSLLLAVSTLGFSDFLTRLHSGFQAGLQETSFCLKDPRACGKDLNLLASAITPTKKDVKLGLGAINIDIHDLENFFAGLIQGLQVPDEAPDNCANDFTVASFAASQLLASILNDYNTRSFDLFSFVDVCCAAIPAYSLPYETDCDFNTLLNKLQHTTLETLALNYIGNSCDLNEAFYWIAHCRDDPQDCGLGVGTIIREEIEWAI